MKRVLSGVLHSLVAI